ncbi:hypothetical protein [Variovorax sp. MHTC-1]|uniref:hypothetical protein n=1 Tax=Variovorax sp. MHTC-1 TaxID=2495593 RepID=UPI000F8609F7|nr:hypothetical protein [Variovorax sp. MHTC-1]RST48887.1 hypothetical protein EJI01_25515 [Variovorax sp. MHTC-1]
MTTLSIHSAPAFLLRFRSLFHEGRGYAFRCNAAGLVAIDDLGERARNNYFFARAMVGRDYAPAEITPAHASMTQ